LLQSNWPAPRSGPSTAHYLLLAAIHRICEPGPKTEVADWYEGTVLHRLAFPRRSVHLATFWDCFDQIRLEATDSASLERDDLDRAQLRLLALWKDKQMVSRRLLSYDSTNFYTFVASTNGRNTLAQRGTTNRDATICARSGCPMFSMGSTVFLCAITFIPGFA